jgi:hypothetical protein
VTPDRRPGRLGASDDPPGWSITRYGDSDARLVVLLRVEGEDGIEEAAYLGSATPLRS